MRLNLTLKIIIPVILLNILVFSIQLYIFRTSISSALTEEFESKGIAIAKGITTSAQDILLNKDAASIQGFIDQYRSHLGVEYIFIVDERNKVIAHTFTPRFPKFFSDLLKGNSVDIQKSKVTEILIDKKRVISIETPIVAGLLGRIYLGMAIQKMEEQTWIPLAQRSASIVGIVALLSFSIYAAAVFFAIKPLTNLTKLIRQILHTNDLNHQIDMKTKSEDEVSDLTNSFNDMLSKLKAHRDDLELTIRERTTTIEKQQMALAESSRLSSLGEMAAGIAHEINNPLAIITSSVKTLELAKKKNKLSDELFTELVEDLHLTVDRVKKIVQGLRNISRKDSGADHKPIVLASIFNDVASLCGEKLKQREIVLDVEISPQDLKSTLTCDQIQISQVFINLINNAQDAIKDNQEKWITVSLKKTISHVQFVIIDSGLGIPEEIQAKIFDPFYTTKDIGSGTGIGLSISSNIIKAHNGSLKIDNKCKNTCFIIEFPIGIFLS